MFLIISQTSPNASPSLMAVCPVGMTVLIAISSFGSVSMFEGGGQSSKNRFLQDFDRDEDPCVIIEIISKRFVNFPAILFS